MRDLWPADLTVESLLAEALERRISAVRWLLRKLEAEVQK